MNNEILIYLDGVVTPERKRILVEAIQVASRLGVQDHVFSLQQLFESPEEDNTALLHRIDDLLQNTLHDSVLLFGVSMDENTPLEMQTNILQGLLNVGNWSDPAPIQEACDSGDDPEGILAKLLELVTQTSHAEYALYLTHVSPSLIDRIDAIHDSFLPEAMPDFEVQELARARVETFQKERELPILSQAIADLLLFGGGYHALIEPYETQIAALDQDQAIVELVGFACASELTNDTLYDAVVKESQGWWEGPSMTKATMLIDKLVKGVIA